MFTGYVSLIHFWNFWAPLRALKMLFYEQIKPRWNPKKPKKSIYRVKTYTLPVVTTPMTHSGQNLVT